MDKVMFYESRVYQALIESILAQDLDFSLLAGKRILITGGTGLVGSALVDTLCFLDERLDLGLHLVLVSRSRNKFLERIGNRKNIEFISHDMAKPFEYGGRVDYAVHLAANTHPVAYATKPVETITTNFLGTMNLLELCAKNKGSRFVNVSSVEIYGESKSEGFRFSENDLGYIDCNTLRSGYNESKRLGESLSQAYLSQYGVDFVTARLCRCYGPTLQKDDSKALSQFLFRAMDGEDIILKSSGEQHFSYIDVFSAVSAIIFIMLKGETGEVYNVADERQDTKLKDLAELVARIGNVKVVFDLPNETEAKGFSKASTALLDATKLKRLGWKALFDLKTGVENTMKIYKTLLSSIKIFQNEDICLGA